MIRLSRYNKRALTVAIMASLFTAGGAYLLGNISGYEAKDLIKASLPGINTLYNTIVLASATILALLLTLLSVSSGSTSKLNENHYLHVLAIAKFDTVVFVASMIAFQLFNIPITEAEGIPPEWFTYIYYITLGLSSVLSGGIIGVALMLYNAISSIIKIVGLKISDHPLIKNDIEEN